MSQTRIVIGRYTYRQPHPSIDKERLLEDLIDKLKHYMKTGTPAERRIARYFSEHLSDLSSETAASIADQLDLSPMTVGRFLRALGYQGLDGINGSTPSGALSSAWQITDRIDVLRKDLQDGRLLAEQMAEQIDTLHHIYAMTSKPSWTSAVQSIVSAHEVFVASFQNVGGIARYFSDQLSYARDRVRYMDGLNGTYLELFGHEPENTLLILIDCRRYATKSRVLAKTARKAGHKVLLLTDHYCDWAQEGADIALILPPTKIRTWDSSISLASLLDFLLTSVIIAGGEQINVRTNRISELQDLFGDFSRR